MQRLHQDLEMLWIIVSRVVEEGVFGPGSVDAKEPGYLGNRLAGMESG